MDNIETPYEEEIGFIQCTICDKAIRGETLYKIHLTTPGHLKSQVFHRFKIKLIAGNKEHPKKEDVLVAQGLALRKRTLPVFEDIAHYLDYMKLDEPIIGLDFLEEVPCSDLQAGPRYTCRLCHSSANLLEMVHHVIGRKHRQKYVELKRTDLVTWDKQSIMTQGGKIIRARAEIIERQDGRGRPTVMVKKRTVGKLNISRAPPRPQQNRDRNIPQSVTQHTMQSQLPRLMDYQPEYSPRGSHPQGHSNTPPVHPEEPYMSDRDRQMYQQKDTLRHDRVDEELQRTDYREKETHRGEYVDPGYSRQYEEGYVEDPQRRDALEPGGVSRYDSRGEVPHGQAQHYPEEAPPYRKPYPERDALKEFYSEEVRRGRVSSQPVYPGDDYQRRSLDRESGGRDSMDREGRQGSREPEAKWGRSPTPVETDRSRDHLFNIIRDYCHERRDPLQLDTVADPGPSRTGPPASQRRVEVNRSMSNIPEPFRRFLNGPADDEGRGKRKRKSRFSDATAEEVETTKEMFSDEYGPPNLKFGGRSRPVSGPVRPEIHGAQHPDLYRESQSLHHSESYQREGSDSGGVFDMLKNIEIENEEEANYLKSKLCNLLKEFKTKKSEKTVQNSHGRAVSDYSSLNPDPEPSPRHQYEMPHRKDSDLRRQEDPYFNEDHRERGWKQHEQIPDERLQEYHHAVHGEPMHTTRSRYEGGFGWPERSLTPHASHPDEPARYPERFQEPMHPREYRPAAEEFMDPHFSAPPLHMEGGPRMDRGPRYSNNLDKITSTLLELVARK